MDNLIMWYKFTFAVCHNAMFNLSIDFTYVKVNLNILSRSQYQLNLQPGVLYLGGRRGKRKVIAAGID